MMECFVLPMHVHWYRPDIRISNCHKSPIYYRHIAASRHNDSPYWKRLPPFQKSTICIDLSNDLWREWGRHASRSPAGAGAPVCLPTRKRISRSRKPAGRRKEHDEQAKRPGEKLSAIKLSVRRKRSRQSAQFPWTVANSLPTRTTGSTDVVDGRTTMLRVQRKRRWTLKRPNTLRRSN